MNDLKEIGLRLIEFLLNKGAEFFRNLASRSNTLLHFLWNKSILLFTNIFLFLLWKGLPTDRDVPFAEFIYLALIIATWANVAGIFRFLFFPESADYAEKVKLSRDLLHQSQTACYLHYRFATIASFTVVGVALVFVVIR